MLKIRREWDISSERIADLFIGAIEGNSMVRSWCAGLYWRDFDCPADDIPENTTEPAVHWYADPMLYEREDFQISLHEIEDESVWNGCFAPDTPGLKVHVIKIQDVLDGLQLMADQYPGHWEDLVSENDDNVTQDVFLQLTVLKKLVYG